MTLGIQIPVGFDYNKKRSAINTPERNAITTGLLRVSHQVATEAAEVLYAGNRFTFDASITPRECLLWLRGRGRVWIRSLGFVATGPRKGLWIVSFMKYIGRCWWHILGGVCVSRG